MNVNFLGNLGVYGFNKQLGSIFKFGKGQLEETVGRLLIETRKTMGIILEEPFKEH